MIFLSQIRGIRGPDDLPNITKQLQVELQQDRSIVNSDVTENVTPENIIYEESRKYAREEKLSLSLD